MKLTRRGVRAMGIEQQHQLLGGLGGRHPAAGTGDDPGRAHGSERITATTALAARESSPKEAARGELVGPTGSASAHLSLVLACLKDGQEIVERIEPFLA